MDFSPPELAELALDASAHATPDEGTTVMEAVAFIAGEPHSQSPVCCCPVIAAVVRSAGASRNYDTQNALCAFLFPLAQSKSTPEVEALRAQRLVDYVMFDALPNAFRRAQTHRPADLLANLPALRPGTDPAPHLAVLRELRWWTPTAASELRLPTAKDGAHEVENLLLAYQASGQFPTLSRWIRVLRVLQMDITFPGALSALLEVGGPASGKLDPALAAARIAELVDRQRAWALRPGGQACTRAEKHELFQARPFSEPAPPLWPSMLPNRKE